jgi:hypothetical protein
VLRINVDLAARIKFAFTAEVLGIMHKLDTFCSDEVYEQNLVIEDLSGPSGSLLACVCAKGQKIQHMVFKIVNVQAGEKYELHGSALVCPQHAPLQTFSGWQSWWR